MPCGHCGFTGDLSEKSFATIKTGEHVSDDIFGNYQWHIYARVMQCPGCEGLTFFIYRECDLQDPTDWPMKVLYPQSPDVHDLPGKVKKSYEKVFPVKARDPASFVVGVGKILEAICTEQGIPSNPKKKNLHYRLQGLATKLPDTLAGMADHLRVLRNDGAHGDTVKASDAEIAADFVEAILNHLYRNPAKLRRVSHPKRDSADSG